MLTTLGVLGLLAVILALIVAAEVAEHRSVRRFERQRALPPPGACVEGMEHSAVEVVTLAGEVVGHVCEHCLLRVNVSPWNGRVSPCDDNGYPLPILPDPSR